LSAEEIVEMVRFVVNDSNAGHPLEFVDFSGVGDCSANWTAVRDACRCCRASGLASAFRLTSVAPRAWCRAAGGDLSGFERVVISLHGADRETRRLIIPRAEDPWQALAWWRDLRGEGRVIDFNYVVHQRNSSPEHLDRLAGFLRHASWIRELRLSRVNPVAGMDFTTPEDLLPLATLLRSRIPHHIRVNAFTSVGSSVGMACGQLRAIQQASRDAVQSC
jgi:adenine C2-methylase RlmN of 23S rRNA A2503 and tRNA A37